MVSDARREVDVIRLRLESLKGNRTFFTVLFTIESAILGVAFHYSSSLCVEFLVSAIFLSCSISLILFGVFSLTDSIHFYTKYLEYRYVWNDKVHGVAYEGKTKDEKATQDFKRALEADDVGYYFLKLSLLSFLYFLASLALNIQEVYIGVRIFVSFLVGLLVTYVLIRSYKATHRKSFSKALKDFFWRKAVFKDP